MKKVKLMLGDNISSLKKLPDNSIDSIVSDPPYGLSFMGKKWDYDVPSVEFWSEVYRVLKPGGHVLSFGGTRTYHRMTVNIEDAGFEIRDQIMWLYGSGFPKSHNIGKAVDKLQGNEREVVGEKLTGMARHKTTNTTKNEKFNGGQMMIEDTKGTSPYEGFGTALKPANEPICVARKPLSEKSVALNVLKWGTGGINIDGCRVGSENNEHHRPVVKKSGHFNNGNEKEWTPTNSSEGRFPANIILECLCDEVIKGETIDKRRLMGSANNGNDEGRYNWNNGDKNNFKSVRGHLDTNEIHTNPMCPCYMMDEQSGNLKSTGAVRKKDTETDPTSWDMNKKVGNNSNPYAGQSGGASRFFYQAKVSKAERNMGLDGFEEKKKWLKGGGGSGITDRENVIAKNNHPTVKPVNLMAYLCRLVTPPNGIILDPFMGSGSTGIAAQLEGFRFCGMELDEDYFKIAEARINDYESYRKFLKK